MYWNTKLTSCQVSKLTQIRSKFWTEVSALVVLHIKEAALHDGIMATICCSLTGNKIQNKIIVWTKRCSLEGDMLTVAMSQAPSRKLVVGKFPTRAMYLNFHWPHRSLCDSVHGDREWLADVIKSSQALQATPQIVEWKPSAPGHKNHRFSSQQAQSPSTCRRDSGHLWYG